MAMVLEFINLYQRGWQPRFNPGPYLEEAELGTVVGFFGGWDMEAG